MPRTARPARRLRRPSPNPSCEHSSGASSDEVRRSSRERRRSAPRRDRRNTWTNYPACCLLWIDRYVKPALSREQLNASFGMDTESRSVVVLGIGEHCYDVLTKISRAQRLAQCGQERFGADAFSARISFGCDAAERSRADDLAHEQRLKPNNEVEVARHIVRIARHHPHRSLCTGVTTREWGTLNGGSARRDQHATAALERKAEGGLDPVKRRLDVGIPILAERVPRLLVQRRHRWRCAGVEHEDRWTHIAKRGFSERRIGGVAGNDRHTESRLELAEAHSVAREDRDAGVTCDKCFSHAKAKPTAATDDENALLFESLHNCSVLLACLHLCSFVSCFTLRFFRTHRKCAALQPRA